MHLLDIVRTSALPETRADAEKLPWDEPEFSARMLREHLSQAHDGASRRSERIAAQVRWIHEVILRGRPTRILDLACGPGLYTARLAQRGHTCVGIDFAPASIAFARATAEADRLACTYQLSDIRTADYGSGFGLILLIYGEFNTFRPAEARPILTKARRALAENGTLLLEVHPAAAVRRMGSAPRTWQAVDHGLFSARPYLRLDESTWDEQVQVALRRYLIIDAETADVTRFGERIQAYSDSEYVAMLRDCGYSVRRAETSHDIGQTETLIFLIAMASHGPS